MHDRFPGSGQVRERLSTEAHDPRSAASAGTTAVDVATFLSALDHVLAADHTATLLEWMQSATDTAADGFDQAFGLLSGVAGDGTAVKQGWMVGADERQLHSVGVLADGRVVVLLGELPESTSWAEAATALDTAAAAVVAGA